MKQPKEISKDIKYFIIRIIIQSFIFIAALSVRDTIQSTISLIPIPKHNIWWKWVQTLLNLFCVVCIIFILLKCNIIDNRFIT